MPFLKIEFAIATSGIEPVVVGNGIIRY